MLLLSLGFNMFTYFNTFTVCLFFFFPCMFVCITCVCPCVSAWLTVQKCICGCWSWPPSHMLVLRYVRHIFSLFSLHQYTAAILHIVSLFFSWHHLSLSVYRRCIKYRSDCSIYLRKYISTQIQASVCIWSFTSNRRRQKSSQTFMSVWVLKTGGGSFLNSRISERWDAGRTTRMVSTSDEYMSVKAVCTIWPPATPPDPQLCHVTMTSIFNNLTWEEPFNILVG